MQRKEYVGIVWWHILLKVLLLPSRTGTFETINKWFMVLCIPCHVQTEIIEINNNNKKHNCIIETCFLYMFRVII